MIAALPLVGRILGDLAASGVGAAAAPQDVDLKKASGAANAVDFTQTVDNLAQESGAATQPHGGHGVARS
jgi:hypothetical protein